MGPTRDLHYRLRGVFVSFGLSLLFYGSGRSTRRRVVVQFVSPLGRPSTDFPIS